MWRQMPKRKFSRSRLGLQPYVRAKRQRAARTLQRAFRRRRRRPGRQRYNSTKNVLYTNLGRRGHKRTLKTRVSALETGSKKHHDYMNTGVEEIGYLGTSLNANKCSFTSILAIQGALCDGTAGSLLPESEQRENDTIFCKSVRIRFMISGLRPNELLNSDSPGGQQTGPGPPPVISTMTAFGAAMMKTICASRIWVTLYEDRRPSTVGANGSSLVNPLPTVAGETILETCYDGNQIQALGIENCLRSYDASRFKIVHQECITTSFQTPHKWVDITYKVNRKLKYVPPRTAAPPAPPPPNPPAVPYNYNLLMTVSQTPPLVPVGWVTSLSPCSMSRKSSRTYFIDS